jgi:hypothetical protein
MRQANNQVSALPPRTGPDHPTVGAIKRALHELSRKASGSTPRDIGAGLREAHDQLRQLALRNGIDPDNAVRQSLTAVALLRDRMISAGAPRSDQASG